MLKMYGYLRFVWWQALLSLTLLFIRVFLDLSLPDYMSRIVDIGIIQGNLDYIINTGIQMLVIAGMVVILFISTSFISSYVGSKTAHLIRKDVFKKIEGFSLVEFDHFQTSSLITRSTNDIAQIQSLLTMSFRFVVAAPTFGLIAFTKAFQISPNLSLVFAVFIPLLLLTIFVLLTIVSPKFEVIQKLTDKLNLVARESLNGLRVIRAFNAQAHQASKFEEVNTAVYDNNLQLLRYMVVIEPLMTIFMSFSTITVIWLSADQIQLGQLQIGQMMAFVQYTSQIMMSFMMLSMIFVMFPRAIVSGRRIAEVLNMPYAIVDVKQPNMVDVNRAEVEFDHVSFRYPNAQEDVLKDVSFKAKAGTTTAFIGSTGSGKSTLINLLPRFYDVSQGRILIDGQDIRTLAQDQLRKLIGYVPQKGILLSGKIEDNLRMAKAEATDEDIQLALRTAQAETFVNEKEGGLAFELAQGATNLSGGQKQRLSIARALLKKPPIYIFDDSFSALDFKTDAALRKALNQEVKDATIFIVGQRVSTIMHADQIIVLDNGKVAGIGKHHDLLKNCSVYYEIASSQLSAEELV
jgi:ATP-binding cassette, subfamily B, multidrug efflux pump